MDNIKHLAEEDLDWIIAVKAKRQAALSAEDKQNGIYSSIRVRVWLKGLEQPLLLTRQILRNEDDSEGILYLVSSDLNLNYQQMTTLYQKRWCVGQYHKSLKNNSSLQASPTKVAQTQSNHCNLSVAAHIKLEHLKLHNHNNHFAQKSKIYLAATKAAMKQVQELSTFSRQASG